MTIDYFIKYTSFCDKNPLSFENNYMFSYRKAYVFITLIFAFFNGFTIHSIQSNPKNGSQKNLTIQTQSKSKAPTSVLFYPEKDLKELFEKVQMSSIFSDSKTFVDAIPLLPPQQILALYRKKQNQPHFNLKTFITDHFRLPTHDDQTPTPSKQAKNIKKTSMLEHLKSHWNTLVRSPHKSDHNQKSSLIELPKSYVVPGGRFREIYYWDSYFTLLGLIHSDRDDLVKDMIDNFAHIIDQVGHIPNGNRSYFLSRSQPPFFGEMIRLIQKKDERQALTYLSQLETEYRFWMRGKANLNAHTKAFERVVQISPKYVLNRYYDQLTSPRPESYREDRELAHALQSANHSQLYRDIRAACESGWDFSSRWFADGKTLKTIVTTQIIPVDLNVLLYRLELLLAQLHQAQGNQIKSKYYQTAAQQRKIAINQLLWDEKAGFYRDFNFIKSAFTPVLSLAGVFPLWSQIATQKQSRRVVEVLQKKFLFDGGLVTTPYATGQQWDYPNGWAPLHWIAVQGLHHYKHNTLAYTIAQRWLQLNQKVFAKEHKMMEKYNVVDLKLKAGGGEYPTQDGFGWTNGVAIALYQLLPILGVKH